MEKKISGPNETEKDLSATNDKKLDGSKKQKLHARTPLRGRDAGPGDGEL